MRFSALLALSIAALALPIQAGAADTDKERAREVRTLQKELTKLEKQYDKLLGRCRGDNRNRADGRACDTARVTYQDVQELKKKINALTKS